MSTLTVDRPRASAKRGQSPTSKAVRVRTGGVGILLSHLLKLSPAPRRSVFVQRGAADRPVKNTACINLVAAAVRVCPSTFRRQAGRVEVRSSPERKAGSEPQRFPVLSGLIVA
jgi:hypothetical protein